MKFDLYEKYYSVVMKDTCDGSADEFKPYVRLSVHFTRESFFHFVFSIPNRSYCYRNPFKCVMEGLGFLVTQDLRFERLKESTGLFK